MNKQLEQIFSYQPPKTENIKNFTCIREKARELAQVLDENCPTSLEKSESINKLREVVMWANASIALSEK